LTKEPIAATKSLNVVQTAASGASLHEPIVLLQGIGDPIFGSHAAIMG
jgi:hypothetical protein